jgi:GLPGLI family protein
MYKKILLLLFLLNSYFVYSQTTIYKDNKISIVDKDGSSNLNEMMHISPKIILDTALLECIYEYHVTDMSLNQRKVFTNILQSGNENSRYRDYSNYKLDSVVVGSNITKISHKDYMALSFKYKLTGNNKSKYDIYKNFKTQRIDYYDVIMIDTYVYEDSLDLFDWKISDSTKKVCGYTCTKAETEFRGRKWTAYFTTEIPISDGPWKFSGLPGLILRVQDSTKEHRFNAISIRKAAENIYLKGGDPLKTNRKQFNKQLKYYSEDPNTTVSGTPYAPKDASGKEMKMPKRFYVPIELE